MGEGGFSLGDQINKETLAMALLSEGFMQAYIDFFYLTMKTTPSQIEPSPQYQKEFSLRESRKPEESKESHKAMLTQLREDLVGAEMDWREGEFRNCFRVYQSVAARYEQKQDFCTASYFHKRCLDVSLDFKYFEGEALAHKGLGFCEENVHNKFEAMGQLETALGKANEGNLDRIKVEILKDLVRVYQQIAK